MSAYLISLLSKTVYSTLKTLCLPASPGSMKFSELTTLLSQHFRIKTSRTTATFLFRQCSQGPAETVTEFAHKLKNKSVDCDFDAYLDRALRDQFIAGLRDIGLKKTILTKPDADVKTFQNVQEIALAEEAATGFANQMSISAATASTSTDPTQVHHASSTSTKKSWQTKKKQFSRPPTTQRLCYRCGSPDHLANKCKNKAAECSYCHKRGHLEQVCLTKKRENSHHVSASTDETMPSTGETIPMFLINHGFSYLPCNLS